MKRCLSHYGVGLAILLLVPITKDFRSRASGIRRYTLSSLHLTFPSGHEPGGASPAQATGSHPVAIAAPGSGTNPSVGSTIPPTRPSSSQATPPSTGTAAESTPANPPTYLAMQIGDAGNRGENLCGTTPISKKRRPDGRCVVTLLSAAHCFFFPHQRNFVFSRVTIGALTIAAAQAVLDIPQSYREHPESFTPGEVDTALLHTIVSCNALADNLVSRMAKPNEKGVSPVSAGERIVSRNRDGSLVWGAVGSQLFGETGSFAMQLAVRMARTAIDRARAGYPKGGISGGPIWNSKNEIVGVVSNGDGKPDQGIVGTTMGFSPRGISWAWDQLKQRGLLGAY